MSQDAVTFGAAARLVGIVHHPTRHDAAVPAVVMLNAGMVHRVGPHRLYVRMARALAARGHTVLRFDHAGIGDSGPRRDNLPFESAAVAEVREAVDFLQEHYGIERFVVTGICSGAMVALQAAAVDPRVAGAILINTQSYLASEALDGYVADRQQAHYFWKVSVLNPRSWGRALTGRISYGGIARMFFAQLAKPFRGRRRRFETGGWDIIAELESCVARHVGLLLLYTDGDPGLDAIRVLGGPRLKKLERAAGFRIDVMDETDHIFTPRWSQKVLIERVVTGVATLAEADLTRPEPDPT